MKVKVCVLAMLALMLNGCGTLSDQVSTDIAPGVSTDVARQVSTSVAEHLSIGLEADSPAARAQLETYLVIADASVNIRACPDITCDIVAKAEHGARLSVINDQGEWLELLLEDGRVGFIASSLASKEAADNVEQLASAATEAPYDCTAKTCGKMDSCEEAVYKLYVCGDKARDANNDGVPCESICRGTDVPAIATSFAGIVPTAVPTSAPDGDVIGLVTRVIDGDTIDVRLGDKTVRIRYVQTNTPERDEPCFRESTQANADLVAGKVVRLVPDKELVDPYDRLLRYVYVNDVNVNRVLVEGGWAEVVLYPPNDAHYDEFVQLEKEAAAAGRGCHPTGIFDDGSTTR